MGGSVMVGMSVLLPSGGCRTTHFSGFLCSTPQPDMSRSMRQQTVWHIASCTVPKAYTRMTAYTAGGQEVALQCRGTMLAMC
jgi:hypothetical protein